MAVHQPHLHLLDFSSPPNAMPMDAPPPAAFDSDDGLLALQVDDGTHMPAGSGGVLQGAGGDSTATRASSSLQVGHHGQPFTASVASPSHQLGQVPAASLQQPFQLRSSKYLGPVRELLSEFCSLEGDFHSMADKQRAPKAGRWDDDVEAVMSSAGLWGTPSLSSMDLMELERRKARLLSMIQEVDRRYRRYREQMRSVEVSFEAVAGAGAAQVYTRLARRAMSRHFRCLRDALTAQVRALRKAMGAERDEGSAAPAGATKGGTPTLRVLDQCLRQPARAVDSYPWRRPQRGLPEHAVAVLRAWLFEHFLHPYPNAVDKHILARQTGLSKSQVSNWFINARVRLWKPMIEDMYKEEVNGQQNPRGGGGTAAIIKAERSTTALFLPGGDQSYHHHHHQQHFGAAAANHPNTSSIISQSSPSIVTDVGDHNLFHSYPNLQTAPHGSHQQSSVVSLTLGLQQQPLGAASSMMQMQQQQRSAGLNIWEGGQKEQQGVQLLPYRNLMGSSQLLHDLAGTDSCL